MTVLPDIERNWLQPGRFRRAHYWAPNSPGFPWRMSLCGQLICTDALLKPAESILRCQRCLKQFKPNELRRSEQR